MVKIKFLEYIITKSDHNILNIVKFKSNTKLVKNHFGKLFIRYKQQQTKFGNCSDIDIRTNNLYFIKNTKCLASPQPQVSGPRAHSLIYMLEFGFVGLLNNPRQIFAHLQKLVVKLNWQAPKMCDWVLTPLHTFIIHTVE